jgi:hypothetical protein
MKRIIYTVILIAFFTSCEKVFEEDSSNKFNINSATDLSSAISVLYGRFCSTINYGYKLFNRSDDRSISVSDAEIYETYKYAYTTIAAANDIIQKSSKLNGSDIEIQHLLGEVYFLRAYTYFCLVRQYGQVPIVDDIDVNYALKKPSFREIYNFIESDLLKAIGLLPKAANTARIKSATPTSGTVKVLLAEVYLTMGGYPLKDASMYAKAAAMAAQVIDSALLYGYALMPDFADLWNDKHRINEETVFALYSKQIISDKDRNDEWELYTRKFIITAGVNLPFLSPGIRFYNSFPESYRKDITFVNDRFYLYPKPCIVDSLNPQKTYCPPPDTIPYHLNFINLSTKMPYGKNPSQVYFTVKDKTDEVAKGLSTNSQYRSFSINYLFRYAHTLLTYAEAKARSGSVDASAYEAVNQLRRRANKVDLFTPSQYDLKPGLTTEQFADSVATERGWEFAGEFEGRWFDLLRLEWTQKLGELIDPNQNQASSALINKETFFYPIPKEDQKLNLNFE